MTKKRNIMRAFKIAEISGVDVPAQEGARVAILKRAPGQSGDPVNKAAALTTSVEGHSHIMHVSYDGMDYNSGQTSWDNDHSHPWVRTPDGMIVIGEAKGHTHEVAVVGKSAAKQPAGVPGADDGAKEPEMTKTVEDLQKQLDRANAMAELTDAQKTHMKSLDQAGQDAFLAKTAAERQAEVEAVAKNAADADPVVYKTMDGLELRKSAGEALIAMAKSNDALRKQNDELAKKAADADLRKRAETDLANLPGDVEVRMALLKSVDGIADETQRTAALNALKAQSAALKPAFETKGHSGAPAVGSEDEQLDTMAKKYQADHPGTSYAKAMDAVLATEAGAALYGKSVSAA